MHKLPAIFLLIALHLTCGEIHAQQGKDSIAANSKKLLDSSNKIIVKKFDPRIATRRSAMIPGWGQIYNRKYWKLPLVYGALGITAGVFFYNVKTYKLLRRAYIYKIDTISANDSLVDPRFTNLSAEAIRTYRNSFRQNVDYSVLFFIVFWGLNIVDATVDGHLKQFDVNDNLTLQLKPGYSPMANTNGLSLVLDIHSKKMKAGK
ncbi:MAG: DUF5683 domain-containing protein [Ferruginibacter sp.]